MQSFMVLSAVIYDICQAVSGGDRVITNSKAGSIECSTYR
jgi:hypothetical protein